MAEYTIVSLGSLSPIKLSAVFQAVGRRSLRQHSAFSNVEIVQTDAPSGVQTQPIDFHQIALGAYNRANHARKAHPNCDFSLGIENGLVGTGDTEWIDLAVICLHPSQGAASANGARATPLIYTTSAGLHMPKVDVQKSIATGCTVGAGSFMAQRRPSVPGDPHRAISGGVLSRETLLADAVYAAFLTWIALQEDGE